MRQNTLTHTLLLYERATRARRREKTTLVSKPLFFYARITQTILSSHRDRYHEEKTTRNDDGRRVLGISKPLRGKKWRNVVVVVVRAETGEPRGRAEREEKTVDVDATFKHRV